MTRRIAELIILGSWRLSKSGPGEGGEEDRTAHDTQCLSSNAAFFIGAHAAPAAMLPFHLSQGRGHHIIECGLITENNVSVDALAKAADLSEEQVGAKVDEFVRKKRRTCRMQRDETFSIVLSRA